MEILKCLLCGGIVAGTTGVLLRVFKRIDVENGLPQKVSCKAMTLFVLLGNCMVMKSFWLTMVGILLISYLCFMAYTDHHTLKVYSFVSYVIFGIGLIAIFFLCSAYVAFYATVLQFFLLMAGLTLLKVFERGDTEIWVASAPYLLLLCRNSIAVLLVFLGLSALFLLIYAFIICRKKWKEYCAMAPGIAVAAAFMIFIL